MGQGAGSRAFWPISTVVALSGLTDLPNLLRFGSVSLSTVLYGSYALLFLLVLLGRGRYPRRLLAANVLLITELLWGCISLIRGGLQERGLQNYFVMLVFAICVWLGGTLARASTRVMYLSMARGIAWADTLGISVGLINILTHGWGSDVTGARWWVGPRSIAMFAVIPLAWHLGSWVVQGRRCGLGRALLWFVVVVASLSRTALLASVIIGILSVLIASRHSLTRRIVKVSQMVLVIGVFGTVLWFSTPLGTRFVGGDEAITIGRLSLNTAGRLAMWRIVWQSAQEDTLLGHGLGSSEVLIESLFFTLRHPHNDYLRVLHDLGMVGFGAWVFQVVLWARAIVRNLRQSKSDELPCYTLALSAFLALFGISVIMVTDNPITYSFIMAPLGLLLGGGVMTRRERVGG